MPQSYGTVGVIVNYYSEHNLEKSFKDHLVPFSGGAGVSLHGYLF